MILYKDNDLITVCVNFQKLKKYIFILKNFQFFKEYTVNIFPLSEDIFLFYICEIVNISHSVIMVIKMIM